MKQPEYEVIISKEALKNFKKIPLPLRKKMWLKAYSILRNNPFPKSDNPKKLKNKDAFRLRIGDYRMVYTIGKKVVHIFIFDHRKEVYRKL